MNFYHEIQFMQLAKQIASNSKDPSRKIGAIAVSNDKSRTILSTGWNGFPRGINDISSRLYIREEKYKYIIHAEMNCIFNACHNGISLNNSIFFVYGLPVCNNCALSLIQCGISSVICQVEGHIYQPWLSKWEFSKSIFDESGVNYTLWDKDYNFL